MNWLITNHNKGAKLWAERESSFTRKKTAESRVFLGAGTGKYANWKAVENRVCYKRELTLFWGKNLRLFPNLTLLRKINLLREYGLLPGL